MKAFIILITTTLFLAEGAIIGSSSKPSCGATTSSKKIELINPVNPPTRCVYRIKAYSKATYQVRLDFTMTLAEPTLPSHSNDLAYPDCIIDYVTIGDFKFCGIETSQHLYVQFPSDSNVIEIVFTTSQRLIEGDLPKLMWNIVVHQLEWSDSYKETKSLATTTGDLMKTKKPPAAPIGCSQYFTHNNGIITSFNYNSGWGIYPNNMNYAICIQRKLETTALKIKLSNFKIGSKHSTQVRFDSDCLPRNSTEEEGEINNADYLLIPQAAIIDSGNRMTHVCGYSLLGVKILSTNPGPLILVFNSGTTFKEGTTKQGFSLSYSLI